MARRFIAVAAFAALLAVATATNVPFTSCGSGEITVSSIDIAGKIAPGNTINITAGASAKDAVTGGSFKMVVQYLGITLITKTGDICNSGYFHIKCPIAAGPITAGGSLDIPSEAPSGAYTVQITATATGGASLFCVKLNLNIGSSAAEAMDLTAPAITQELVDAVNSAEGSTWTAGMNERFRGRSLGYAKGLCGVLPKEKLVSLPPSPTPEYPEELMPTDFDALTKWPKCADWIGHIRDQADCGSCWAFGSTEAFNDRKCIATDGAFQTELSAQDTTSCCTLFSGCGFSQGCSGGDPGAAWNWFVSDGVVSGGDYDDIGKGTTCFPYQLANCNHHEQGPYKNCSESIAPTPACPNPKACSEKSYATPWAQDGHKAKTAYSINSVAQMQSELMTYGSITVAFTVYADFLTYREGVYTHQSGSELGGHAVKIMGWGVENNTPYWLVANSWNKSWGADGFFKIKRGVDECGIESQVSAGHA